MNTLITGINGSGASFVADYIRASVPGCKLSGTVRSRSQYRVPDGEAYYEADMLDVSSLMRVLMQARPDRIFHIAANADVRASFETPLAHFQNNALGTANLFEAIRIVYEARRTPSIMLCSSSEVYGRVSPDECPITEDQPMRPVSPYGVSKAAQDLLGYQYYVAYNMPIVRTRMFSYLNPRRKDLFATAFARQVARIELGLQDTLVHGNLDSVRTIIDGRDAAKAYWLALDKGVPGEVYNIGGTSTYTVGEVLDVLKGLAHQVITDTLDPALLRPVDMTLQIPDCRKFCELTGWEPEISFEDSIAWLLDECRAQIRHEVAKGELLHR